MGVRTGSVFPPGQDPPDLLGVRAMAGLSALLRGGRSTQVHLRRGPHPQPAVAMVGACSAIDEGRRRGNASRRPG